MKFSKWLRISMVQNFLDKGLGAMDSVKAVNKLELQMATFTKWFNRMSCSCIHPDLVFLNKGLRKKFDEFKRLKRDVNRIKKAARSKFRDC